MGAGDVKSAKASSYGTSIVGWVRRVARSALSQHACVCTAVPVALAATAECRPPRRRRKIPIIILRLQPAMSPLSMSRYALDVVSGVSAL